MSIRNIEDYDEKSGRAFPKSTLLQSQTFKPLHSTKNGILLGGAVIPNDALPGDTFAGTDIVRVTHFGYLSNKGDFHSTKCTPFNYNKFGSMRLATTITNNRSLQQAGQSRRNFSVNFNTGQSL